MLLQTSDVQIKKVSQKGNIGTFEFSPLPGGFGRTLGSSLRRVLLTSLEGAAITQVKIPSIAHQFTTVPGVKEDVVEICLNLKQVKARSHSKNPVVATIKKSGPGVITAADIIVSSEVEILNKDLHIAELADSKATFEAELLIETGVGYDSGDERKSTKVGVLHLDALYSPVLHVEYSVEATRQGEITGLDKLLLTVTTTGAVTPEDAVVSAATIIRNFFSRFAKGPDPEEETVASETAREKSARGAGSEDVFLEDLALPTRTINALKKQGIDTLQKLSALSDEDIADIKNLGEKSVKEIYKILEKEGLR